MKSMIKNFIKDQKEKLLKADYAYEDKQVLEFLDFLDKNKKIKYLEVGAGLGRFPLKIRDLFNNLNLECLEINPDLAKTLSEKGIPTTVGDVTKLPFADEAFDIVHCSHVIEHFKYPEIAYVLDHLLRVTKPSGYIIIRSPLWHPDFYLDIDHVRPYPPETIMNYLTNPQQQKVGAYKVKIIKTWYRRGYLKIFYLFTPKMRYVINSLLAILWLYLGFPFSKKNGYVLILQKN